MKIYRILLAGSLCGMVAVGCATSPTTAPKLQRTVSSGKHVTLTPGPNASASDASGTDGEPQPTATPSTGGTTAPTPTPTASGTASSTVNAGYFGQVLIASGQPADAATVDAYDASGSALGSPATTDAQGKFKPDAGWSYPATLVANSADSTTSAIQFNVAATASGLQFKLAQPGIFQGQLSAPGQASPNFSGTTIAVKGLPSAQYNGTVNPQGLFFIGNLPASATGYTILATSPTLGHGSSAPVVMKPGQTASATIALSTVSQPGAPTLSALSATNGAAGTSVTITGTNFGQSTGKAASVSFDGTSATSVTVTNDDSLTAVVPVGAQTGGVTVTVGGLTSNAIPFSVLKSLTITPGILRLFQGEFLQYAVTGLDTADNVVQNPAVSWSGSNAAITVSGSGLVTADSAGSGTLTATNGTLSQSVVIGVSGLSATVSTLAGSNSPGSSDGTGVSASFNGPTGLCFDAGRSLFYVGDQLIGQNQNALGSTIRAITTSGAVTTLAGQAGAVGAANGTGNGATFDLPIGVAVDSHGNVFVVDNGNNVIREVTPQGVVTTFAGSGTAGHLDGAGTSAEFLDPFGLAIDANDNLYVSERGTVSSATSVNDDIRKITPAGVVSTLCGSTTEGAADGSGPAAQFSTPLGLAVDSHGNLFVADNGNNLIREVTPAGVVSTFAGSGQPQDYDGTRSGASLYAPTGLAVDANDDLYVEDGPTSNMIREITPAGVVTTVAGSSGIGPDQDGSGLTAIFNGLEGLAVDASGNVYAAENTGLRVRKITFH